MSGLAVVFHRDGAPATDAEIQRMTARVSHRGPDGIGHWTSGPAALGHCALHLLPEDIGQTQPLHSANGLFHLTFDGRLDNREELLSALGLQTSVSDARIVLAAYEKWGEFCPERFLGDFAFALWDDRRQHLFCARDILGVKPFYFFRSSELFLGGSERSQLFTNPRVRRTPNESFVCGFLMSAIPADSETLHQDVHRLPPASAMTVTRERFAVRRYWNIHDLPELSSLHENELQEQLWTLVVKATRSRMRGIGPVAIQMSGGLDSTTVAAAASEIDQAENRTPPASSLSLVFPGIDYADESELICLTNERLRLQGTPFLPHEREPGAYERDVQWYEDLPDYFNDAFADELRTFARQQNRQIILTGHGGDEWFTGSSLEFLDRVRKFRLQGFLQDARLAARSRKQSFAEFLWSNVGRPLIPGWLVRAGRQLRSPTSHVSRWIHPDLARRSNAGKMPAYRTPAERRLAAHHGILTNYELGRLTFSLEMNERLNARHQVEFRSPLNDRRVIEFALGIPPDVHRRNDVPKSLLRRASADRLPPQVTGRTAKAHFANVYQREFQNHAAPLFDGEMAIFPRNWIQKSVVTEFTKKLLASPTQTPYCPPVGLWHVFGLELMIRAQLL